MATETKRPTRVLVTADDGSSADYDVFYEDYWVVLYPSDDQGSVATSSVERGLYAYTHGGPLYQAAVDKAKELQAAR